MTPLIVAGARLDVLDRIRDHEVALAIWRRALPPHLSDWLAGQDAGALPRGHILASSTDIVAALCHIFEQGGVTQNDERRSLLADIARLAIRFSMIMAAPAIDIRLDVITGDACWKFHRDRVPARLVTTYRGAGTQWVAPVDAAAALQQQRTFSGNLLTLLPQEVAIFKGSIAEEDMGIVHRSPPIAGSGETRLLCVIDPESAASPELWRP
ncbi:DUF1826 domain-containing protein [Dongia mobilis]|uniref:DUF1826 domain-containing protein n=1 Tax=Dongia sp. TaxID=1977262 RepID=UPI0026ED9732